MAGPTRLELATSGVTGRRSNQLNYDPTRGTEIILYPNRAWQCIKRRAVGNRN